MKAEFNINCPHHLGQKTKMRAKCANGGKNCIIITILVNAKE